MNLSSQRSPSAPNPGRETFTALEAIPGIQACFLGRVPHLPIAVEKEEALRRLAPSYQEALRQQGLGEFPLITAEQIHDSTIALVTADTSKAEEQPRPLPGVDGLATASRGITLGIFVADCAPVWIIEKNGRAGALIHSGKRGTQEGIVPKAIKLLEKEFQCAPSDLILQVGPCIRPPCYEVDFAAIIRQQAALSGVTGIHDDLTCTACHPNRYYSYRREQGCTGRMLALLTLLPSI